MKISRETDYAIRCLLFMARDPLRIFSVGEISGARVIPPSFLAKILQKLARAVITSSARGAGGGFRLIASPDRITLLSVIEALEGPMPLNDCLVGGRSCLLIDRCSAHVAWKEIRGEIAGIMRRYTIRQLLDREEVKPAGEIHLTGEGS
jgi:Rrf2 family nitric oxide-sensitive transcriptional repressor